MRSPGPNQNLVLQGLRELGACRVNQIAEHVGLGFQPTFSALNGLVKRGLAEKIRRGWYQLPKQERLKTSVRDTVSREEVKNPEAVSEEGFGKLLDRMAVDLDRMVTLGPYPDNNDPLVVAVVLAWTHVVHAQEEFRERYGDRPRLRHKPLAGQYGGPGEDE